MHRLPSFLRVKRVKEKIMDFEKLMKIDMWNP
jgi:hypothetical protein